MLFKERLYQALLIEEESGRIWKIITFQKAFNNYFELIWFKCVNQKTGFLKYVNKLMKINFIQIQKMF